MNFVRACTAAAHARKMTSCCGAVGLLHRRLCGENSEFKLLGRAHSPTNAQTHTHTHSTAPRQHTHTRWIPLYRCARQPRQLLISTTARTACCSYSIQRTHFVRILCAVIPHKRQRHRCAVMMWWLSGKRKHSSGLFALKKNLPKSHFTKSSSAICARQKIF